MGMFNKNKKVNKRDSSDDSRSSDITDFFLSPFNRHKKTKRDSSTIPEMCQRNPWTYLAVDKIAESVASADFYIEDKNPDGTVTEIVDHELLTMLNDPNPLLTGLNQDYLIQASIDLTGESLILIERDAMGAIEFLFPVESKHIRQMPYYGYPYWDLVVGSSVIQVYVTEVIYLKKPDWTNFYGRGRGKASALVDEIKIHEKSSQQIAQYFENGAIPEYLIVLENGKKEQAERLRDDWLNKNQGWVKRYLPHFTNGKTNIHKLQSEFKDMQLVELRSDEKDSIMQYWGIPPELYGKTENSNRANTYVAETNFAKQILEPRLKFLVNMYNIYLMPEYQNKRGSLKLKHRSTVPRDREFEASTKKNIPWAFNLNEHRETVGAPPVNGFDKVYPVTRNVELVNFEDLTDREKTAIKSVREKKKVQK